MRKTTNFNNHFALVFIILVQMQKQRREKQNRMLSTKLIKEIKNSLQKKKESILTIDLLKSQNQ